MQQPSMIDAAAAIFALISQVRHMPHKPDLNHFRGIFLKEIETFVQRAGSLGFDQGSISIAQYVLCATLDESILFTPWGQQSGWAGQGLVLSFYQDVNAGEKFFIGLNKLIVSPAKNLSLLELFYSCISLGFRGRFALVANGQLELERIRKQVFKIIETHRGHADSSISKFWQSKPTPLKKPLYLMPFWWSVIISIIISILMISGLRYGLGKHYERQFLALEKLEYSPQIATPSVAPKVTLRQLLKTELDQGYVELSEVPGRSIIRIKGDELFTSGSARISEVFVPVIERIAKVIDNYGGMVTVAGHTDNRRARTLSFQSNFELSKLRAQNVADIMVSQMPKVHIAVIGRGDVEPLMDNATTQGRARNRRVEIRVDSLK